MIKIINLFLIIFSLSSYAINVSTLEFQATQQCPAYLSKNNKTNPNNLMVQPGSIYQVREINKPFPDWFRIEMKDEHTLRWVSSACGVTQSNGEATSSCDSTGMADSYVLALSSQPGFCETYGYEAGKPECRKLSKDSYQARHLTLHGLWPNKDICGQHYGFCASRPLANHCDYAPVNLSPAVDTELKKLMPSYYYGSCLERHEWNKHGSCQSLSANEYFSLAMRLATEVDNSPFGNYLTTHQGQTVQLTDLREMIDKTFGAANKMKIFLGCRNNILVDIYIQLPQVINDVAITQLVDKAPNNHTRDLCGKKLTISQFTKDKWF